MNIKNFNVVGKCLLSTIPMLISIDLEARTTTIPESRLYRILFIRTEAVIKFLTACEVETLIKILRYSRVLVSEQSN